MTRAGTPVRPAVKKEGLGTGGHYSEKNVLGKKESVLYNVTREHGEAKGFKKRRKFTMKEFLIGLLVLVSVLVLSGIGLLLLPFFIVLGFFLKLVIGVLLLLVAVWLIGKVTLVVIDLLRTKDVEKGP